MSIQNYIASIHVPPLGKNENTAIQMSVNTVSVIYSLDVLGADDHGGVRGSCKQVCGSMSSFPPCEKAV